MAEKQPLITGSGSEGGSQAPTGSYGSTYVPVALMASEPSVVDVNKLTPLLPDNDDNNNITRSSGNDDKQQSNNPMEITAPALPLLKLFLLFLSFGFRAWGGPAAQIQMVKAQLVDEERWCSQERFKRVFAVYQVLPGPEATELCCYFGLLSRGRLGAFIAGMGFVLPGFVMMMVLSWVYVRYGLSNPYVQASFVAIQVRRCALSLPAAAAAAVAAAAFATAVAVAAAPRHATLLLDRFGFNVRALLWH